jgi:hypothetical protein
MLLNWLLYKTSRRRLRRRARWPALCPCSLVRSGSACCARPGGRARARGPAGDGGRRAERPASKLAAWFRTQFQPVWQRSIILAASDVACLTGHGAHPDESHGRAPGSRDRILHSPAAVIVVDVSRRWDKRPATRNEVIAAPVMGSQIRTSLSSLAEASQDQARTHPGQPPTPIPP